jgi:acyl dehydratase
VLSHFTTNLVIDEGPDLVGKPVEKESVVNWFDDLVVGMRFTSPEKVVTREDIKRFASEFDPQPYHLDEVAAEQTPLKGLAACWHTAAIAMRLAIEVRPFGQHPLLGLGVDELRWLAPVRPGDRLRLEGEVVELTPSKTKPQGIARIKWTAFNQRGEPVYTFTPLAIVPREAGWTRAVALFD